MGSRNRGGGDRNLRKRTLPHHGHMPEVGRIYVDSLKRRFAVKEFHPNQPDGREVRGVVEHDKHPPEEYSCTLQMFQEIWAAKVPPMDPAKMKIG